MSSTTPKFHGIALAANSVIENLHIERLQADPVPVNPGRFWVNMTERAIKFSGINAEGAVVVHVMASLDDIASVLADAKTYTDGAIAALKGVAPEVLDTLQEIATALNNDPNLFTTITNLVSTNIAAAKAEIRGAVDEQSDTLEELHGQIVAETARATKAEGDETTRATGAEAALQTSIAALQAGQTSGSDALAAEVARATGAEAGLQSNIDSLTNSTATRIGTLTDLTTTAKDSVVLAINELQAAGAAEATRAGAAETAQSLALTNEIARASTAENNLSKAISDLQDTIGDDVADKITALQTDLAAEATRAGTAESSLQDKITAVEYALATETSNRNSTDASLQGNIDAANAAIAAETTRATAAETANSDAIAAEVTRATAGEKANSDAIVALQTQIGSVTREEVSAIAKSVADETTRATGAETLLGTQTKTVSDNLAVEVTRATDAEKTLHDRAEQVATDAAYALASEVSRATGAESSLQAAIDALGNSGSANLNAAEAASTARDALILTTLDADKATYESTVPALVHTFEHGIAGQVVYSTLVQDSDGNWRNDFVSVQIPSTGAKVVVTLTEAANVRIAVISMAKHAGLFA